MPLKDNRFYVRFDPKSQEYRTYVALRDGPAVALTHSLEWPRAPRIGSAPLADGYKGCNGAIHHQGLDPTIVSPAAISDHAILSAEHVGSLVST